MVLTETIATKRFFIYEREFPENVDIKALGKYVYFSGASCTRPWLIKNPIKSFIIKAERRFNYETKY
jgi:hypothetical protein